MEILTQIFQTNYLALIIEPLQYAFMFKAMAVSVVVGIACAILSCFLVLGAGLYSVTLFHTPFYRCVVIAYIIGILWSRRFFVFAMLAVVLIGFIKTNSKIKEDAV